MAKWTIDPDHSFVTFSVKYMMISNIRGQCNKISGTIHFDPSSLSSASVEATIDITSIYTGIKKRDEHLRSADFFEANKFPTIAFKSAKIFAVSGNTMTIAGNLTMHGVTRPVTLKAEFSGPVRNPFGDETTIGFVGTTKINRDDFGISQLNDPLEGGGMMLDKEVNITLDIQADLIKD